MRVTLPTADFHPGDELPAGVRTALWDLTGDLPWAADGGPEVVVLPYLRPRLDWHRLAEAPRLRVVQTLTAGTDGMLERVPAGVALCNAQGVHDAATAELAVALILAAQRGLPEFVRAQDQGQWTAGRRPGLADRRVLIVGAGSIGSAITARLLPFEVTVTQVGRTARPGPHGPVRAVADLPVLLPEHDVVVLIVPLTEQTRGLVDAAFLAAMPDGALLVNVARGPIVDTDALLPELLSGRLRAAVDVTDPEPLPDGHPLWVSPNVLISPHVGGDTEAFAPRARAMIARQLRALEAGGPPLNVVGVGSPQA